MITRTFLSKCNTITNASKENFGLNPICSLSYGGHISRVLIYFDVEELHKKVDDGTYKNREKLRHVLKMTNCGTVDYDNFFTKDKAADILSQKHRASSFDVIAFKVPKIWDAGNGFDKSTDTWFVGYRSSSKNGSTWENSMTGMPWKESGSGSNVTSGIYSSDFLWEEYNKWYKNENGEIVPPEGCIVISRQHFDYGNENLEMDITDFVNSILFEGEKNYGLCLAFSPKLEETVLVEEHYIHFFTNNTNTFFVPYVESRYNCKINDDRYKFYLGRKNRLYFYAIIGGIFTELDEMPTCSINGVNYEVFNESKGIYYVEVKLPKNAKERVIMTDVWSNLKLDGEDIDDVEMDFVTLPYKGVFNFGEDISTDVKLNPIISGINDDQKLNQGDIREISVAFRVPYTSSDYELLDSSYYRIYVKDGTREIDVVDWDEISTIGKHNSFMINTSELIPQSYYVDIKANIGRQVLMFKNVLHFTVVDNVSELKK